ncbi:MAG: GNAT family N-acetyltransferase, partial [Halorientalis sp.]
MNIEMPAIEAADALADLWVDLAAEQRQYGSKLKAGANRDQIRESLLRAIVTDGCYVARTEAEDDFEIDADEILGFVMFGVDAQTFETTITRGTIQNLYVRPDYRNEGIGSKLLDAATANLADRNIEAVKLEVMVGNEAAERFYRRHGFDPHRIQLTKRV